MKVTFASFLTYPSRNNHTNSPLTLYLPYPTMVKFTFALFAAAVVGTLSMAAPVTKRSESSIFASSNLYSGRATWCKS